ncbi:MAG: bifunctional alpha,alpha-trehalose-phosphate synthase (UDP-forming)/trehalose-phosphatase [Acidobacteria bacterium]|nr:bifunctional alpha,alpha-trehalose-phosphate synthase (UDP-forming)/trehalose-phosphatase [Acidobacteriota bacterium]MCA1618627.1 bifunctional alpha,alpha-trehalose-phosphate synthase (UDP-forming)/trehalose-phosphatase [Acidobacteriota bacterium]
MVSNRLPYTLRRAGDAWKVEKSAGGLATAMGPILRKTEGVWVGWSGDQSGVTDARRAGLLARWAERERYVAVDLPPETARGFYEGFSNQTLWPLFHNFPYLFRFDPADWDAYREANRLFCEAVLEQLRPGDMVWVHDYQLMLLPRLLREAAPEVRVGFFLHIPFPPSASFRILPRREELLRGLLGADLIAFHTHRYLQHFRDSVLRLLGTPSHMDKVEAGGRTVRLEALPIGIAPEEFTGLLDDDEKTGRMLTEMRERFRCCKVLLAVDRLDYTKGIPERLRAFRQLLTVSPESRGKVVLIQVAVPSRERIPMYGELRREVDGLVGKINGEFSTPGWTPIVYLRRNLPRAELAALYALADVAWISPLRDGLNLVAKEYVACQRDGAGVLLLSEFAGAAAEMGEAIMVNPYDEGRTAESVARALALPLSERRERMAALHRRVTHNNVFAWGERFIGTLREAASARTRHAAALPAELPAADAARAFREAESRLLLLDYDGTLVGYAKRPQDAKPPAELIRLLARLAQTPATTAAIVSGRSRGDIEGWFGDVRGLWLAAEHGAVIRPPGSREWEYSYTGYSPDWKRDVYPYLEHYADRTPGSFVEEKEFSLVWHYRMSDPEFGEWLANELAHDLEGMLADTPLRAVRGQKSVEVRPMWADKGEVMNRLTRECPAPAFLLAAGDDKTDEDLFARLPATAWTIHVGENQSRARFRLSGPGQVCLLLEELVAAGRVEVSRKTA